jgi:4-hydroxy-4-methyl-2-oxoglutarate aldolase
MGADSQPARDELIRRFGAVSSPTVYDVLDRLGFPNQALSSDIRPLGSGRRIAGPAMTMRGTAMARPDGRWGSAISYGMFRAIQPGDVIVFDCGGHMGSGPWGGNTAAHARVRGAAGAVIDGATRDRSDLVQMGFPTFCRAVTPVLAHGRFRIESFNEPITMGAQLGGRVAVSPGDYVVADDDGIVVVPRALLVAVLELAEYAERAEGEVRRAIEAGEDRESIDRRIDRWALLKARRNTP